MLCPSRVGRVGIGYPAVSDASGAGPLPPGLSRTGRGATTHLVPGRAAPLAPAGGLVGPPRRRPTANGAGPRAGPPAAARPLGALAGTTRPGPILVAPGRLVGPAEPA